MRLVKFWSEEEGKYQLRMRMREMRKELGFLPRSFTPRVREGGEVEIEFFPDESGKFVLWKAGGTLERAFVLDGAPKAPWFLRSWEERDGRKVMVLKPLAVGDAVRVARSSTGLIVRVPWRVVSALNVDVEKPLLARFKVVGEREMHIEFVQLE